MKEIGGIQFIHGFGEIHHSREEDLCLGPGNFRLALLSAWGTRPSGVAHLAELEFQKGRCQVVVNERPEIRCPFAQSLLLLVERGQLGC